MPSQHDWSTYYANTQDKPPSELLLRALPFVSFKGKALDIGGGALKDSRFLLKEGFDVTDLDAQPLTPELIADLDPTKFHHIEKQFADFSFPEHEYDLASAMFSLPFNRPASFNRVFRDIQASLKVGGIFCGTLFGDRDQWVANPNMTFQTRDQAIHLIENMEELFFNEREWDGKIADGTPKHWHLYEFILRKEA